MLLADCWPAWHASASDWAGHVARGREGAVGAGVPLSAYRGPIGQLLADRVRPHLARGWPAPCGLILPFLPSSSVLLLFLPSPLSTQKCHQFIHLNEQVFRDFGTVNGFNSVRAAKRGLDLLMG